MESSPFTRGISCEGLGILHGNAYIYHAAHGKMEWKVEQLPCVEISSTSASFQRDESVGLLSFGPLKLIFTRELSLPARLFLMVDSNEHFQCDNRLS